MIKISGRHAVSGRWGFQPVCFLVTQHLRQQEYIVSDPQSNTAERYTWDADHQPRYDDIWRSASSLRKMRRGWL